MTGGIEVRGLTVRRAGRVVLRDLSFDAPRGQVLALVGPSGAGKSTLLRCLNRLAETEAGTIGLDGEDIRGIDPPALRRRVALVAQAPVMLPGTVADNLVYGLAGLRDGVCEAALAAAGLDGTFLPRVAKALSGGERARVALARALTRDPDAILLDEPTAALDPDTAQVIAETVAALARRDLAVIVATHDAALADAVADATLRLASGPVASGADGAAASGAGGGAASDAGGAAASGAGGAAASGAGGGAASGAGGGAASDAGGAAASGAGGAAAGGAGAAARGAGAKRAAGAATPRPPGAGP